MGRCTFFLVFIEGIKNKLDVITLEQTLHTIQKVVVKKIIEGGVVFDRFLIQGSQSLHS